MKKRKTGALQRSHGRLSWMISLLSVAILIAANAAVSMIDSRIGLQLDLSEEKKYEVSDVSQEALKDLAKPVEITMLADESAMETGNSYTALVYHLLKQYSRLFPQLSLSFVDLVENPTFASGYPQYDLKTYDTIVSCGEKSRQLSINDMFSYETNGYSSSVRGSVAEQTITNAILAVSAETQLGIVCLDGFSGTSPDALLTLYESVGASVSHTSLVTEDIDPNADVAVLFDTRTDPDEASLAKLDRWLSAGGEQGKTLLVFSNPYHHLLPNLNAFLEDWNLKAEDGLVVDTTAGQYYSVPYCPVAQTVSEALLPADAGTNGTAALMLCSPVSVCSTSDDKHKTEDLLQFSAQAAVLPLDAKSEEDAVPTASPSGIIRSDSVPSASGAVSTVILTGSCEAVSAEMLGGTQFSNYLLFSSLAGSAKALASTIRVPEKNMAEATLSMPRQVVILCIVVFLVIIPLAVLAAGILIWLRRRHG